MIALDGQCIRLVGPQIARPRPGALPSDLLASALLTTCSNLQSDEILACFEEALGERQPEMGTDAAAGREANAESAEAAPRLEAAAEQQREHSLLAPTAGRGVEPVLPDPVPIYAAYEFRWRAQIVRARCRRRSADRVGSCEHSRAARRGGASEGARYGA